MAQKHPKLAEEFHPTKNKKHLSPKNLIAGTNEHLVWVCCAVSKDPCGHEWIAQGNKRAQPDEERGCPRCAGYGIKPDEPAYLYCLWYEGALGDFWKVGIAINVERRRKTLQTAVSNTKMYHDYRIHVVEKVQIDTGLKARLAERRALNSVSKFEPAETFDGSSEFVSEPVELAPYGS